MCGGVKESMAGPTRFAGVAGGQLVPAGQAGVGRAGPLSWSSVLMRWASAS
jgi:hypothetical protein